MKKLISLLLLSILSGCESVPITYRVTVESEPVVIYVEDYPSRRGYREHIVHDCDCEEEHYHRRDYYRYYRR